MKGGRTLLKGPKAVLVGRAQSKDALMETTTTTLHGRKVADRAPAWGLATTLPQKCSSRLELLNLLLLHVGLPDKVTLFDKAGLPRPVGEEVIVGLEL